MSECSHFHDCEEGRCCGCGESNIVWSAPSDLWESVVAGRWPFLCPICFVDEYELIHGTETVVWRMRPLGYEA